MEKLILNKSLNAITDRFTFDKEMYNNVLIGLADDIIYYDVSSKRAYADIFKFLYQHSNLLLYVKSLFKKLDKKDYLKKFTEDIQKELILKNSKIDLITNSKYYKLSNTTSSMD
jgi:hypothetical protein